ncbi:MAG: hypothetical protein EOP50_19150 [Sphingobacteriales bacterium]|nr:MAG: hypothetical protein EOP50_19150 [Sphingobacteriales bacterium]
MHINTVRDRMMTVRFYLSLQNDIRFRTNMVENCCLQIRKSIEVLAFASLVANKQAYASIDAKFHKEWNSMELMRRLNKLNPDFFPTAVEFEPNPTYPASRQAKPDSGKALTREDAVKIYSKCSEVIHSRNPFNTPVDITYYYEAIANWVEKIDELIAGHMVTLTGTSNRWLFQLVDVNGKTEVNFAELEEIPKPPGAP